METLNFEDVTRSPLLRTDEDPEVITYWPIQVQEQPLGDVLPFRTVNRYKIEQDIEQALKGGMTPLANSESEASIVHGYGRGKREWTPAHWKEKAILTPAELRDLRRIGSRTEYRTAQDVYNQKVGFLLERLARRVEYMRHQVLFDGTVTGVDPFTGVEVDLYDVAHPADLQFTATTPWSNPASDPLADLQLWVEEYEDYSEFRVRQIMLPHALLRQLTSNQKFRDIAVNSHAAFRGERETVRRILADYVGLSELREVRDKFSFTTTLLAPAAAAATTITIRNTNDLSLIENGTEMFLLNPVDMSREKVIVDSIAGNVVTLQAGLVRSYPALAPVKWHKYIIPLDKVLMVGAFEGMMNMENSEGGIDASKLRNWGSVVSTLSNEGDMMNPRPGIYRKNIDKLSEDPSRLEHVIGVEALPLVDYVEGWATATVL